eukprot:3749976-Prymnesium_polylepis.1
MKRSLCGWKGQVGVPASLQRLATHAGRNVEPDAPAGDPADQPQPVHLRQGPRRLPGLGHHFSPTDRSLARDRRQRAQQGAAGDDAAARAGEGVPGILAVLALHRKSWLQRHHRAEGGGHAAQATADVRGSAGEARHDVVGTEAAAGSPDSYGTGVVAAPPPDKPVGDDLVARLTGAARCVARLTARAPCAPGPRAQSGGTPE